MGTNLQRQLRLAVYARPKSPPPLARLRRSVKADLSGHALRQKVSISILANVCARVDFFAATKNTTGTGQMRMAGISLNQAKMLTNRFGTMSATCTTARVQGKPSAADAAQPNYLAGVDHKSITRVTPPLETPGQRICFMGIQANCAKLDEIHPLHSTLPIRKALAESTSLIEEKMECRLKSF